MIHRLEAGDRHCCYGCGYYLWRYLVSEGPFSHFVLFFRSSPSPEENKCDFSPLFVITNRGHSDIKLTQYN